MRSAKSEGNGGQFGRQPSDEGACHRRGYLSIFNSLPATRAMDVLVVCSMGLSAATEGHRTRLGIGKGCG